MRLALGQFNATVGDLAGNVNRMRQMYSEAMRQGADLIVFPELAICGYPPEDLLHKDHFLNDNRICLEKLATQCPDIPILVGFAESDGSDSYNSAAFLKSGQISQIYQKGLLPNYGVFDEHRYFRAGTRSTVIEINGLRAAVTICADIWDVSWLNSFLAPVMPFDLILNISASPFYLGKIEKRKKVLSQCAKSFGCAVCYCNLVGGQDELIFDGRSIIVNSTGEIAAQANAFEEDILIADFSLSSPGKIDIKMPHEKPPVTLEPIQEVYNALVLGTRDYAVKNGFKKTLLGLSGGIDSSVVAAIAVAALGPESLTGITMPSKFNATETISDAEKLARNLGIEFLTIPIEPPLQEFDKTLGAITGWDNKGTAFENLQARIRGSILMSLSNQFGSLVLTTGNKSETAVGYSTLYGDTAGGFAMLKDVPKTIVYELAEYINKINSKEIIPADVISRPPSAELRADQKDSDSLPDYDLLDAILKGYVEQDKSARELVDSGMDKELVLRIIRMVDRNEYKRRQSPPGIKITPKAFGKDRRLPITNRYNPHLS